jgi:hypothetical protein
VNTVVYDKLIAPLLSIVLFSQLLHTPIKGGVLVSFHPWIRQFGADPDESSYQETCQNTRLEVVDRLKLVRIAYTLLKNE